MPENESPKQVPRPRTAEPIAPNFVTFRLMRPQTNGPRKKEPMAPHETERMATIVGENGLPAGERPRRVFGRKEQAGRGPREVRRPGDE
jgi:hypothetical protein